MLTQNQNVPYRSHNKKAVDFSTIKLGNLSLKLADSEDEIKAAQHLRYDIFYKDMGAHPIRNMAALERDYDDYDNYCDHFLVIDEQATGKERIIGTYRALSMQAAQENGITLYTETEFDFSKLRATGGAITEVSRSCVRASHRGRLAINLLWKGIATYVVKHGVDYLIGTPSFQGIDVMKEQETLAYLKAFHLAPEHIRPRTIAEYYVPYPEVAKENIDAQRVFQTLPPLLKGYLRLGGVLGDGLYIDHQFNCIDTSIVVGISSLNKRYIDRFTRDDV